MIAIDLVHRMKKLELYSRFVKKDTIIHNLGVFLKEYKIIFSFMSLHLTQTSTL